MPKFNLVSQEWCNLVFEGKNKKYGAYLLRSEVGKRYTLALLGVGVSLIAILIIYIACMMTAERIWQERIQQTLREIRLSEAFKQNDIILQFVELQPTVAKVEKQQIPTLPEIVDHPQTETAIVPMTQSVETATTEELPTDTLTPETLLAEEEAPILPPPPPPSAEELVSQMPTFPGGVHKLMKWLDKNIIYPPLLAKEGIEGTTYLTFFVDTAGVVNQPAIEEPLHPMISSAILKAARQMPKWEPAVGTNIPPMIKITIPIAYYKR